MSARHADAPFGDIRENQHEETGMRDIHAGKRGSEGRQYDSIKKVPSASASSDPLVALEYLASGETQNRPGSILVQKSGHVDDDVQNFCV